MIQGLVDIGSNLGIGFENLFLLIIVLGGFIFYAKDFKVGLALHFLGTGLLFVGLYYMDASGSFGSYNYVPSLVCFLIFLVVMSFSLYFVSKSEERGVFV